MAVLKQMHHNLACIVRQGDPAANNVMRPVATARPRQGRGILIRLKIMSADEPQRPRRITSLDAEREYALSIMTRNRLGYRFKI